jgi:hypothetical protein
MELLSGIAWGDLTALEPRLGELLWAARHASVSCVRRSDVDRAFAPVRNFLAELVGFAGRHRGHPILGSAGAYQVAYWKLYDAVGGMLPGRNGATELPSNRLVSTKENVMVQALQSRDRHVPVVLPITEERRTPPGAGRRFRFNRTIGFWLGGFALGTAGCLLGACMPYHHPVAVTISVLWWGIYLGCFGASIGVLLGMRAEANPAGTGMSQG